jgi:hypothetical protein
MNNRFVVPAGMVDNVTNFGTLHDALTVPGLNAGDFIQIEPHADPGPIGTGDIPALKNLTIQGDPAFDVQSIPYFVADAATIGSAQKGITFENVQIDIQNGPLVIGTDAIFTRCLIMNDNVGTAMVLSGTTAAVISNCFIENTNPLDDLSDLVQVDPAAGSHNLITDNQFLAITGTQITLLSYSGGANTTDVVANNSFVGNTGNQDALFQVQGTQGLAVLGNTFTDDFVGGTALEINPGVENLRLVDNVISVPNGSGAGYGIFVNASQTSSLPISMVIADNHISTGGQGTGIFFQGGALGVTFAAKVENNDLQGNQTGVGINSYGESMAGVDLGGGSQGSSGANDFRGDPTAIQVTADASEGPISAQLNIFGVSDPTSVIHDQHVDPFLAAVVSTNSLTGNAAYVETLFLDFLHRTGDLENPGDAGYWVTRLGQGLPAATVANLIARSPEALGDAVGGLYHRFLGRDADPAGRAAFVAYLQNGGTLEGVSEAMLASPEYQSRFPTDSSFVQSLYENLLRRPGTPADVSAWVAVLPRLGRAGVAQDFLSSPEFRAAQVDDDYAHLLHRTPLAAELSAWVGSGLDLLTMDTLFAGLPEFQVNG